MRRSLVVLIAAGALIGCGVAVRLLWPAGDAPERGRGPGGRPVTVVTAPVARRDMPIYLDGLGTVQAYRTVTVRSRIDGQLTEIGFREGQDVHTGDLLARIDPRTYKAALDQAVATREKDSAQLGNAKRDLERYLSLGNRVTGQSVDSQRALVHQLEAAVRADQAAVDSATTMLSYTVITSPIEGRTGLRQVDEGNIVHANDVNGLVVLTQLQPIAVVFTLPQQTLQSVLAAEKDDQGRIIVLATQQSDRSIIDRGVLELVDNQIDPATGTIKLKAVMPNQGRQLWPGGFVAVRLLINTRKDGLVIPAPAVQRGPQGTYAFVVKEDSSVEVRTIKVAASEADLALVEDGLSDGERVVVDGGLKLQSGSKIMEAGAKGEDKAPEGKPRKGPPK